MKKTIKIYLALMLLFTASALSGKATGAIAESYKHYQEAIYSADQNLKSATEKFNPSITTLETKWRTVHIVDQDLVLLSKGRGPRCSRPRISHRESRVINLIDCLFNLLDILANLSGDRFELALISIAPIHQGLTIRWWLLGNKMVGTTYHKTRISGLMSIDTSFSTSVPFTENNYV